MKRLFLITGAVVVFTACQAVFTYSPVSFLQRDVSFENITDIEQIKDKAREVLVNGSASDMKTAYNAVNDAITAGDDSPDTALLAADLAFGASGVNDVFTEILSDPESLSGATEDEITEMLGDLDFVMISAGATHVQNAVTAIEDGTSGEVTETQYIIAGASLLVSAANDAGGFENLDSLSSSQEPGYDDYEDAKLFLSSGGIDDILSQFGL